MKRWLLILMVVLLSIHVNAAEETEVSEDLLEAEGQIFTIKVKSAEIMETADDYGTEVEPKKGDVFLLIQLEAKNISDEDDYFNRFSFLGYADDFEAEQTDYLLTDDWDGMMTGDIVAGKGMRGYLIYEVPEDWKVFELDFEEKYDEPKLKLMFTAKSDVFE